MGKLGIIGGMGPLATQLLYKEITEKTVVSCDQDHLDMIILSHASMPDRTEAIKTGNTQEVKNLLIKDARFLEENGVCAIAIPCNTSHFFLDDVQKSVKIPVINMVKETVLDVIKKKPNTRKIGVLATDGTNQSGIYKKECEKAGIECFVPEEHIQKLVMKIIYEQIKVGLPGNDEDFNLIDEHLKQNGCDAAILACTELSCYAKQGEISDFYIDALDVLCEKAITMCGKEVK